MKQHKRKRQAVMLAVWLAAVKAAETEREDKDEQDENTDRVQLKHWYLDDTGTLRLLG